MDAQQNHDKYLYDLKDFSGQATPNTDPEMVKTETPPVPPNPECPDKPTMDHLTIDARTKGVQFSSTLVPLKQAPLAEVCDVRCASAAQACDSSVVSPASIQAYLHQTCIPDMWAQEVAT